MKKNDCPNCEKVLSEKAIFCGRCKTQIKCLNCKEMLSLDDVCCEVCGTDIKGKNESSAMNRIVYDGKKFEAKFTDTVGKDVTETFGNIFMANQERLAKNALGQGQGASIPKNEEEEIIDIDSEEVDFKDENDTKKDDDIDLNGNYPHIEDIKKKMSFNEKDWIIIYAFYKSNHGETTFSKADIRSNYKDDRRTKSRMKKFYLNWDKAYREAFATQKVGELKFTDEGVKIANNLITRKKQSHSTSNSGSSKPVPNKVSKGPKKVIAKSIKAEKFDMYSESKTLKDFFEDLGSPKRSNERILAIGYYINNILGVETFTDGNIDYAYKALKLDKRPTYLRQIITNIKNRHFWFEAGNNNSWIVSRDGEIYIENKLNKS